jgi:ferredoxin-NADP reductase/MOSC domain-containing protein YiiM
MMASLLSVNVGMPKNVPWQGRTVHTGIWKTPVDGPRMVRRLNIDGDGQGDRDGHGGEQRAVLVYQVQSYAHWSKELGRDDFGYGQFGENFTVDGLPDDEVCIGDRYRVGEAEFEVTQPRVTCFRVGMRLAEPRMAALLVAHHRPGFYLRVITEGHVQAGQPIVRTRTGPHRMTVAEVDALLYLPDRDTDRVRDAIDIPALSPGWRQSFHEMLDGGEPPPVGHEPTWTGFRPMRVTKLVAETPTVTSLYLEPTGDERLPTPKPGQYLTLRVDGAGDPPPVRSYSLSADPGPDGYRISVKRADLGVVSTYLDTRVKQGAVLDVAAPRGDFVLDDGADPVLLISAGIGVTPVLAMLHQLAASHSERDVWWIHTTHDATQHAFAAEAHALLGALSRAHEHVFYTAGDPAGDADVGTVRRGRLTAATLRSLGLPAHAQAYLCGPPGFMSDVHAGLLGCGIAAQRVHTELFEARSAINPGVTDAARRRPHPPAGPPGSGPEITFARSGLTVPWPSDQRTLLELAEACDVPTRWSCRTGVCHTCATNLLSGDVDYDPEPLEPPDTGDALLCCSRPRTAVVLDL